MYNYQINCQFLQPRAAFTAAIRDEVDRAMAEFNQRSMNARNPKRLELVGYPDPYTMAVSLASREMLELPSKALKLFSQLLVEMDGEAKSKLTNGRMFVMCEAGRFDTADESGNEDVRLVHRLSALLLKPRTAEVGDKLERIRAILNE